MPRRVKPSTFHNENANNLMTQSSPSLHQLLVFFLVYAYLTLEPDLSNLKFFEHRYPMFIPNSALLLLMKRKYRHFAQNFLTFSSPPYNVGNLLVTFHSPFWFS